MTAARSISLILLLGTVIGCTPMRWRCSRCSCAPAAAMVQRVEPELLPSPRRDIMLGAPIEGDIRTTIQ